MNRARIIILSSLFGLCVCAQAESVVLVGTLQGQRVGSVTFSTTIAPDHSWTRSFVSDLNLNGVSVLNESKTLFSADGKVLEENDKETVNGSVKDDSKIVYSDGVAIVTNRITGEKKKFPAPASPPTKDPSDLWFIKTRPKLGDKSTASSFSSTDGWRTTTVSYIKDKPFKLGDKTIQGHLLKHEHPDETFEELVDDQGLELEFEMPGIPGLHFARTTFVDL